ncbi:MAG: thioredoxin, partial [Chitinophagales bacterium]
MSSFQKIIQSEKPILIDFFAEWCGPCKALAPTLKQVANKLEGKARVIKIDIDKNESLASQLNVRSVPTLMVYKNGKQLWRQSGALSANDLTKLLESFI